MYKIDQKCKQINTCFLWTLFRRSCNRAFASSRPILSHIYTLTFAGFIFFRPNYLYLKMQTNVYVMSKTVNKKIPTERIQKLSERIVVQQYIKWKKQALRLTKICGNEKKHKLFRVQNIDVAKRVNDMHSINYMFLPQLIVVFQSQDIAENVSLCIGRSNAHTTLVSTHPAQNSKRKISF